MKYILRHMAEGEPDAEGLKKALQSHNVEMVDASALPKMAVVDVESEEVLRKIRTQLNSQWDYFPFHESYKVPDTRFKISNRRK